MRDAQGAAAAVVFVVTMVLSFVFDTDGVRVLDGRDPDRVRGQNLAPAAWFTGVDLPAFARNPTRIFGRGASPTS